MQVWSTQGTDSQWRQGFFSQGRELADSKVQAKLWEESQKLEAIGVNKATHYHKPHDKPRNCQFLMGQHD
jgi:hypothetical protein